MAALGAIGLIVAGCTRSTTEFEEPAAHLRAEPWTRAWPQLYRSCSIAAWDRA